MTSSPEKCSFLIPARNAGDTIWKCLTTIPKGSEILLWDDHSSDNTVSEARAIRPNIKIYTSAERISVGEMRHRLFKLSSREIVIFQDADDYRFTGPTLRAVKEVRPNSLVVSPLIGRTGSVEMFNDPLTDLLLMTFQTNCLIWHRTALEKLSFSAESCWEYHMFLDAILNNIEITYVPYFTAVYTGRGQYSKEHCLSQIIAKLDLIQKARDNVSMSNAQFNLAAKAERLARHHHGIYINRCLTSCYTSEDDRSTGKRCLSNCNRDE